jgi:3-oxoacyl-[acyl-carrier protein] reductase
VKGKKIFEQEGFNFRGCLVKIILEIGEEKMELKGEVAIVTGAGSGIGRETALELAKAGARLVLADIIGDTIEKVKREIEGMGKEALAIQMDVSKWEEAKTMANKAMERFGRIDILVNNAGISPRAKGGVHFKVIEVEDSVWDTVLNVNLKGVFNCSKAVIPFMISQRSGKIVNMGSTTGLTGDFSSAPYCASKAGVLCLTKVLAKELGRYNINVNAVAPGLTLTPMHAATPPEMIEASREKIALGRPGEPIDIARAVLFLVSENIFITGQTIVVDGGSTMH